MSLKTMAPFSKEDKDLIKTEYEQKEHNARQFMTEIPNKNWTNRLLRLRKYGTGVRAAAGNALCAVCDDETMILESLHGVNQQDKAT